MKKSYILCPYGCTEGGKPREVTVSGMTMHVRNKHPEKFEEFKTKFAELKKSAIVKETTFVPEDEKKTEPPKVETPVHTTVPPASSPKAEPPKDEKKAGDEKPEKGKSFLERELNEFEQWLDSPDL